MSSGRAFLGHAGETGFLSKGDGDCGREARSVGCFCSTLQLKKVEKGTGLPEEQLTP